MSIPSGALAAPYLQLLQGFSLRVAGQSRQIPAQAQRVLAFLALQGRSQNRASLAEHLWSDMPGRRAAANLRTALWRIRQADTTIVETDHTTVRLGDHVVVDVDLALRESRLLLSDEPLEIRLGAVDWLGHDLLPAWDEEWILLERERLRQLRLHSLEAMCQRLSGAGRHAQAIEAGQAAVAGEPLRESAQAALIRAHLAEGNLCEARRQFLSYSALLIRELGVEPSEWLRDQVSPQSDRGLGLVGAAQAAPV